MSTATIDQREICARFGSDVVACEPAMKIGMALGTLDRVPLNALRHPVEGYATGWYVWGGEYSTASDFFQPVHAEHLDRDLPKLVPYLALAPARRVLLAPDQIDVWYSWRGTRR